MADSPKTLHPADYAIFGGMLVITMAIGIYHAWAASKKKTTSEYLVGSRNLNPIPVSLSLMASFMSSILMLGFPAEIYTGGVVVWWQSLGICLGAIMAVTIFVPTLHPLKLTSVNQYLQMRYRSTFISILGSLANISFSLLYTGIVYYAPATALESVTGFPTWGSIIVASSITIIYTTIGGFKAVIWSDVFQAIVMICCLLAVTIKAILKVGSFGRMWALGDEWERINFFVLNSDPTMKNTFWSLTFGMSFTWITFYGTSQSAVQRYSSLATLKKATFCVLGVLPGVILMVTLASLAGLAIFAFYTSLGCDPIKGGYLDNANQLVPFFLMDTMSMPGMPGLLFAGLASASLSTASSNLNSGAANMWDDIIRKIWPKMPESKNVLVTKALVCILGVLSSAIAFAVSFLGGTVIQVVVTFSSATGGPTTAMFLLGVFIPSANWIGAGIGWFVGFAFGLWVGYGSYSIKTHKTAELVSPTYNCSAYVDMYRPWLENTAYMNNVTEGVALYFTSPWSDTSMTTAAADNSLNEAAGEGLLYPLYSLSYLWLALVTMVITFCVGLIISFLTGGMKGEEVSKRYLHPAIRGCAGVEDRGVMDDVIDTDNTLDEEKSNDNAYVLISDERKKMNIISSTRI